MTFLNVCGDKPNIFRGFVYFRRSYVPNSAVWKIQGTGCGVSIYGDTFLTLQLNCSDEGVARIYVLIPKQGQ